MITYAQNFEDVILARLFAGLATGFYIDIGAAHPTKLSVTRHFYDIGWCGVNIEPIRRNWELFIQERPRDINLNVAVGTITGSLEFCEVIDNDALSTIDERRIIDLKSENANVIIYTVNCVTGDSIFEQINTDVDFLKIDVEGAEADVLRSINLQRYQPKVLVVEATKQIQLFPGWENFKQENFECWNEFEPYILQNGYQFIYFDGLNRFYVRSDLNYLATRVGIPPGVFDYILPDQENFLNDIRKKSENAFSEALQGKINEIQVLNESLIAKERVIEILDNTLRRYKVLYCLVSPIERINNIIINHIRQFFKLFRPRIGNLNQYPPCQPLDLSLSVNKSTRQSTLTFAIITPSFQQGSFIERSIKSILDQNYPYLEYYVQDGGSSDATVDVLMRHAHLLHGWASEKDAGQSQAINRGFVKTNGEIMAWLNSDDLLLPGALHAVANYFDSHPEVDVIYGDRILFDQNDMEIGRWILPPHDDAILIWADFIPQETMFWRRRIWNKAGGKIDESFQFAMDWDLIVRFRAAGAIFSHVPLFLGAFRIHEHQKTSSSIDKVGYHEMNRIRERLLGRVPSDNEIRKAITPYLIKHVIFDLIYRFKKRIYK